MEQRADPRSDILAGIRAYLAEHFPGDYFREDVHALTKSVFFGSNSGHRLEVTETFFDGEDGATKPLDDMRRWNVAKAMREAGARLVTLTTTGLRVEE